jgi:hypothetical protein
MRRLIVTSKAGVDRAFGTDAFNQLSIAMEQYLKSLGGESDELLVVDDEASAALLGIGVTHQLDASSIANSIRAARNKANEDFSSVLLVGGPNIFPHFVLPNTVTGDSDSSIPTDNPYGCLSEDERTFMTPDVAVGRLVGFNNDLTSLKAQLLKLASLRFQASSASGSMAIGVAIWNQFTSQVARSMGASSDVRTSPSFVVEATSAQDMQRRFLYFNLHGFGDQSGWYGADNSRLYGAVSPDALGPMNLSNAVIFAANCFGAAIESKSSSSSCALAAIQAGARVFIGSTCFSFGSGSHSESTPLFSDRLAQLFFERCGTEASAGTALVNARIDYVKENLAGDLIQPRERKTSLQFIFLGDPNL